MSSIFRFCIDLNRSCCKRSLKERKSKSDANKKETNKQTLERMEETSGEGAEAAAALSGLVEVEEEALVINLALGYLYFEALKLVLVVIVAAAIKEQDDEAMDYFLNFAPHHLSLHYTVVYYICGS